MKNFSPKQYISWNRRPKWQNLLMILFIITATLFFFGNTFKKSIFGNAGFRIDRQRLRLDNNTEPNEKEILRHMAKEFPYLPVEDIISDKNVNRNLNSSCAWYPRMTDIKIRNDYWQDYYHPSIPFYLFGAYLDNRPTVTFEAPVVRILAMLPVLYEKVEEYPKSYCQFWFESQPHAVVVPVDDIKRIWYYEWGHDPLHNYPHLLTCSLPEEYKMEPPATVSLVAQPCDQATNMLKVYYDELKEGEKKKGFAVCIKALDFPHTDLSHRIVEYMETLRVLGADKVVMYDLKLVHANTSKILDYYKRTGFLDYRPFSLSVATTNENDFRHYQMAKNGFSVALHEIISYNDCLYRSMYRYRYIALADFDEVPMPVGKYTNWYDLLDFAESEMSGGCSNFASYCLRRAHFPRYPEKPAYSTAVPQYFYMLQHVRRSREHISGDISTKCFHSTDHLIATHHQFPMHFDWLSCPSYSFDNTVAQLNHYAEPSNKKNLEDPVEDLHLWRFKDEIVKRSMKVFEDLNFFERVSTNMEEPFSGLLGS